MTENAQTATTSGGVVVSLSDVTTAWLVFPFGSHSTTEERICCGWCSDDLCQGMVDVGELVALIEAHMVTCTRSNDPVPAAPQSESSGEAVPDGE